MPSPYLSAWSPRLNGGVPSWELRQATIQQLMALNTSDKTVTAAPNLSAGDTLEWTNYPDVEIFSDGAFRAGPGINSFNARALDSTGAWGAWGTQTITSPSTGVPVINTPDIQQIPYNEPFSQQLVATGAEPITWDVSAGALPTGLALSSSGLLSGTATVGSQAWSFTARATNADGNDTQAYSGSVATPAPIAPTITTLVLDAMGIGNPFSQQLVATGDAPINWGLYYPALPLGLTISSTGLISGTPTQAGGYICTVSATNATGADLQEFSGEVSGAPEITLLTVRTPISKGQPYSEQITATGVPAPTFSLVAGALPNGVSLQLSGVGLSSSGLLSGTPTTDGTFNFTVRAENASGFDDQAYTQQVTSVPVPTEDLSLNGAIMYVTGGPTVNEGLYNYFGGTGTTLKDRERAWLEGKTAVRGTIEDMWHDYLYNVRGYAGSRNDMELRFWQDGGAAAPASVITKGYTAVWNQFAASACGYRLNPAGGSLSPDNLFAGDTIAQLAVTDNDVLYLVPLGGVQFPDIVPGFVWFSFTEDEFDTIALEWDTIDRYVAHVPGAYVQAQTNIGIPVRVRLSGDVP
jgi:hypothetical protein